VRVKVEIEGLGKSGDEEGYGNSQDFEQRNVMLDDGFRVLCVMTIQAS
jgi:hypothetical protein